MCAQAKKSADYKAEEEQEWCSRKGLRGGGSFPRGHWSYWLHGRDKEKEGQERDKMASYEHL